MSAKRRLARKAYGFPEWIDEPGDVRRLRSGWKMRSLRRRRARVQAACRAIHWKRYLGSATFDGWNRPIDQNVRVAFMHGRCLQHHLQFSVPIVVTADEEYGSRSEAALVELVLFRLRRARDWFVEFAVPRGARASGPSALLPLKFDHAEGDLALEDGRRRAAILTHSVGDAVL